MKKLAMFVVLSMLCCFYAATSLAAQTNYWKFHIVADERIDGNSEPVPKNDSEQICHVTPTSGVSDSKGFYVRSRTYVGDHEASQAMKIAVNNHHYKLKYPCVKVSQGRCTIFVAKRIKTSLAVDVGIRKTCFNMPREVYTSRGISIMAINTCGDCQMKGSVRYE